MTRRPGHHAPHGTVASVAFVWVCAELPQLDDVLLEVSDQGASDEQVVQRAYRVVGIIEGASTHRFRLRLERLPWEWPLPAGRYFRWWRT